MKCSNCNYEQEKVFKHCPDCGAPVSPDEQTADKKKLFDILEGIDTRTKKLEEAEEERKKVRAEKVKAKADKKPKEPKPNEPESKPDTGNRKSRFFGL